MEAQKEINEITTILGKIANNEDVDYPNNSELMDILESKNLISFDETDKVDEEGDFEFQWVITQKGMELIK